MQGLQHGSFSSIVAMPPRSGSAFTAAKDSSSKKKNDRRRQAKASLAPWNDTDATGATCARIDDRVTAVF